MQVPAAVPATTARLNVQPGATRYRPSQAAVTAAPTVVAAVTSVVPTMNHRFAAAVVTASRIAALPVYVGRPDREHYTGAPAAGGAMADVTVSRPSRLSGPATAIDVIATSQTRSIT